MEVCEVCQRFGAKGKGNVPSEISESDFFIWQKKYDDKAKKIVLVMHYCLDTFIGKGKILKNMKSIVLKFIWPPECCSNSTLLSYCHKCSE